MREPGDENEGSGGGVRLKRQKQGQMGAKEEATSMNGRGLDLLSAVNTGLAPALLRG